MATLVKTTHAAIEEEKNPKVKVRRRVLNFRNTPYPNTGVAPSQLLMNRPIGTRIPQLIKNSSNSKSQEARLKDQETRSVRKNKLDLRKTAKNKDVLVVDKVLVSQRKSTTKPPHDPRPLEVIEIS